MTIEIEGIKLYKAKEIANLFEISIQTVYNLIKAKKLKATRIGRSVYITERALKEFIEKEIK